DAGRVGGAAYAPLVSLRLALRPGAPLGPDRDLLDHRRLQRAAAAVHVLVADDHRLLVYFTHHLPALHHFSEGREVPVEERRLVQGDVERAAGGGGVEAVNGADGPLVVRQPGVVLVVELRVEPVADAAVAELAGPQRAAGLDRVEPGAGGGVVGLLMADA